MKSGEIYGFVGWIGSMLFYGINYNKIIWNRNLFALGNGPWQIFSQAWN